MANNNSDNNNNSDKNNNPEGLVTLGLTSEFSKLLQSTKQAQACLVTVSSSDTADASKNDVGVDVCCVVDKSGSMAPAIADVKAALIYMTHILGDKDRMAIVAFDDDVTEIMPLTSMTESNSIYARTCISSIKLGGSTNLHGGLTEGIEIFSSVGPEHRNNVSAVILLTDGHANRGKYREREGIIENLNPPSILSKGINREPDRVRYCFTQQTNKHKLAWIGGVSKEGIENYFMETKPAVGTYVTRWSKSNRCIEITHVISPKGACAHITGIHIGEGGEIVLAPSERSFDSLESYIDELTSVCVLTGPLDVAGENAKNQAMPLPCNISTIGFSTDHDARLLKDIAERGNGTYSFVNNEADLGKVMTSVLSGFKNTVARNVELVLETINGACVDKVRTGFPCMAGNRVVLPDMQAGETRSFVVEMELPPRSDDMTYDLFLRVKMTYTDIRGDEERVESVSKTIAVERGNTVERNANMWIQVVVERARQCVSAAMKEALERAYEHKVQSAREVLEAAIVAIRMANTMDNTTMHELVRELEGFAESFKDEATFAAKFLHGDAQQTMNSYSSASTTQRSYYTPSMSASQTVYETGPRQRTVKHFTQSASMGGEFH